MDADRITDARVAALAAIECNERFRQPTDALRHRAEHTAPCCAGFGVEVAHLARDLRDARRERDRAVAQATEDEAKYYREVTRGEQLRLERDEARREIAEARARLTELCGIDDSTSTLAGCVSQAEIEVQAEYERAERAEKERDEARTELRGALIDRGLASAELQAAQMERDEWKRSAQLARDGFSRAAECQLIIDEAIRERDEARAHARVLAHAYEHDTRPPPDVVREAMAYPVGSLGGSDG